MPETTPTPWKVTEHDNGMVVRATDDSGRPIASMWLNGESPKANADLIIEAVNTHGALVKALELQEAAEEAHANCDECEGEEVPELCPKCFPLFDDARLARRHVLSTQPRQELKKPLVL